MNKTVLIVIGIIIILIVGQFLKIGLDQIFGVTRKTINADNIIYNYEWFKMQYNDYLQLKSKIQIAELEQSTYKQTYMETARIWQARL